MTTQTQGNKTMLYNVSADAREHARAELLNAVAARVTFERDNVADSASKIEKYILPFAKQCANADAFALAFIANVPRALAAIIDRKNSVSMFDAKALPFILALSKALNGGTLPLVGKGTHEYLRGAIYALASAPDGEMLHVRFCERIDAHMQRFNATWHSGSTWGSKTRHAFETFGIVAKSGNLGNCHMIKVQRPDLLQRLVDACDGIYAHAADNDTASAMLALPAPDAADVPASDDRVLVGDVLTAAEIAALDAPDVLPVAHDAPLMLAAPDAPASAPAKRTRGKRK